MIYLAYDGSLNGDWVSRYAIRFAAHAADHTLTLVHVRDGRLPTTELQEKIDQIDGECRAVGVTLAPRLLPPARDVLAALLREIPPGAASLVVCGTRVRSRQKAFLAGTVAERLLRQGAFPVLAVRVVQPGLLGAPRDLLLPLAGHPRGFASAWPFFRLFLPDLESVHLLRAVVVSAARLHHLTREQSHALRAEAARYLDGMIDEIRSDCGEPGFHLDSRIVLCADWGHEILVQASRLKARLILLGGSERPPLQRLLHGDAIERVLRGTPCDVGVYRTP